jgi:hypothetical protein
MQFFLFGYIIIEICEIFTVGGFPLNGNVRLVGHFPNLATALTRQGFTAVHLGAISATFWVLLLNALVGFQLLEDGRPLSMGLVTGSALVIFVGTGYIALDTAFGYTGYFNPSLSPPYRNIGLYVLYQLLPLVFLVGYFAAASVLTLKVLGEPKPLIYLTAAALLFAIGQIFNYAISVYICNGTSGAINGAMFETFFTLLAVVAVWHFWHSITEDDFPGEKTGEFDGTGQFAQARKGPFATFRSLFTRRS